MREFVILYFPPVLAYLTVGVHFLSVLSKFAEVNSSCCAYLSPDTDDKLHAARESEIRITDADATTSRIPFDLCELEDSQESLCLCLGHK